MNVETALWNLIQQREAWHTQEEAEGKQKSILKNTPTHCHVGHMALM